MSYFDDVIEPRITKGTYYTGKVSNKMAYEQKDMSGVLFKNERKTQDNHPDYQGNAMVNGVMVDLSAWIKESSNGKKRLSISFKPKQELQPDIQNPNYADEGDAYSVF